MEMMTMMRGGGGGDGLYREAAQNAIKRDFLPSVVIWSSKLHLTAHI